METKARRREIRTGHFTLELPMRDAFKLFTAEGERLWVPDWSPAILGALPQAPGLVFLTGTGADHTIWTVLDSECAATRGHARYSRVTPGSRAGIVDVQLTAEATERTRVDVSYDLTALSPDGERALDAYDAPRFAQMLESWRTLITSFLAREGARETLATVTV